MIDIEALKVAALIVLIAAIATALRRRAGLIVVLWAIALGFAIAARIVKMQALRQAREAAMQTAIMQDALNREMQREMMQDLSGQIPPKVNFQPQLPLPSPPVIYQPEPVEPVEEEAVEDELIEDEWDDYGSDE
jgi:hypothetical protein